MLILSRTPNPRGGIRTAGVALPCQRCRSQRSCQGAKPRQRPCQQLRRAQRWVRGSGLMQLSPSRLSTANPHVQRSSQPRTRNTNAALQHNRKQAARDARQQQPPSHFMRALKLLGTSAVPHQTCHHRHFSYYKGNPPS